MPFDNTPDQSIESRIIDETLRILGPNGENWIKGSGVDDKFCLLHALNMARQNLLAFKNEIYLRIIEAIRVVEGQYRQIPDFNDDPNRTFPDVLRVLELSATIKPSESTRKLWAEFAYPTPLVQALIRAEHTFHANRRRRVKTLAGQLGIVLSVCVLMFAAVCIPA